MGQLDDKLPGNQIANETVYFVIIVIPHIFCQLVWRSQWHNNLNLCLNFEINSTFHYTGQRILVIIVTNNSIHGRYYFILLQFPDIDCLA